jgi:CDP-glycerol glycerophosphotransferase (TagB/SpsB family)
MQKILKFIAYLICYCIYPFSYLIPRTDKILVFGSYRGGFNDNTKYLFIYANEHLPHKNKVWISTSKSTVEHITNLGFTAYHIASFKGVYYALRAGFWFVNSYTSDIAFCLAGHAKIVNLWHGLPMKTIEFGITRGELAKRYVQKDIRDTFYHPAPFRRPDYLISTTTFLNEIFSSSFRIHLTKCLSTGYPRTSLLCSSLREVSQFIQKYESDTTKQLVAHIQQYDTVLVYMPTWRDSQRECFANGFDLNALNACATAQNACVLMKPHANTIIDKSVEYSNLIFLDGNVDMYCILPYTHVLITDYSSILYDYILMPDKHVILFHYDYEEYVNSREFIFDIQENIVGRKVYTFDELIQVISTNDYTMDTTARQKILDKFWGETSGKNSCELVFEKLQLLD